MAKSAPTNAIALLKADHRKGHAYSNVEIAAVANYVTARFGATPSSITAQQVADIRRQASQ